MLQHNILRKFSTQKLEIIHEETKALNLDFESNLNPQTHDNDKQAMHIALTSLW